jgi:hypothetical protein
MGRRPFSNTRAPNAIGAWAALLAATLGAPGCSFIFSEGAPANHRDRSTFQCGESYVPPLVDTAAVGLFALAAIGTEHGKQTTVANAVANGEDMDQAQHDVNVQIALAVGAAALDAASAIYGYHAAADCRAAQELRTAEVMRARLLPPPYGVPPTGEPPPLWPPSRAEPAPPTPSP